MHCLLTALGSYGDVFPMVALAETLQSRGHEVELIVNPHFADVAAGAGLAHTPIGTADDYDRLTQNANLWSPVGGLRVVFESGALAFLSDLYELVAERHRPGQTVIAAHGLDLASRVAAEKLGARVASIVYAPMALWSDASPPRMPAGFAWRGAPRWLHRLQFRLGERAFDPMIRPRLNAFRGGLGLPELRGSFWDWYYGMTLPICLFPDWFVSPDGRTPSDWPDGAITTGFPLGDAAGHRAERLAPEVEAFLAAGEPPIVFTPGSAMRFGGAFFAAAVEACQRLGRRGVLLSKYAEHLPADLPATILAPGFTPLARLLERSAAFVHHGGIGSCARGLAAGVPQLIQPMGFDQHDNARRLQQLGVADELSPRRFRGPAVARKLDSLLRSPTITEAVGRWSKKVDRTAALDAACAALEGVGVAEHQPHATTD